jgi:hypothetical protein
MLTRIDVDVIHALMSSCDVCDVLTWMRIDQAATAKANEAEVRAALADMEQNLDDDEVVE